MPTFPHSALSACIVGDDLHTVVVSVSPIGAKVRTAPTLERFLSMSADEARRRLEPVAAAGRVVLTCPASWCALRPIGLGVNQWPAARDDLLRSLDRLLPIPPDDAMIGLVQLHDSQGASAGGELVEDVSYQETYRDAERDGPDRKRVLFTVNLRDPQRTLTGEEADRVRDAVAAACEKQFNAALVA